MKKRFSLEDLMSPSPLPQETDQRSVSEALADIPSGFLHDFLADVTGAKCEEEKAIAKRMGLAEAVAKATGQPEKEILQKYTDREMQDILARASVVDNPTHIEPCSREKADQEFAAYWEAYGPKPLKYDKPKSQVTEDELRRTATTEDLIKNLANGKSSSNV